MAIAAPLIMGGASILGQLLTSLMSRDKEGQYGSQPTLSPEQQDIFSKFLGSLGGNMGGLFEGIQGQLSGQAAAGQEAEMKRQYQQEFMPQLAEQYGGAGALGSSGFAQQSAQGSERLLSNLANLRAQTQQEGINNLKSLLGLGIGTQTSFPTYTQPQPGMGTQLAPMFGQLAGQAFGNYGSQNLLDLLKQTQGAQSYTQGPYGSMTPGRYDMYSDRTF